ncbi:hypothetical protein T310_8211, partial [Rasamsonia emersonii CBS 393.64]
KQETARSYTATGGILTAEEGQQLAQQAAELQAEVTDQADAQPRRCALPRCSNCNVQGHTRLQFRGGVLILKLLLFSCSSLRICIVFIAYLFSLNPIFF